MRPRYKVWKRALYACSPVYITRLGHRVLCSLDPNWQAAIKAFSSQTESADPVKVLTAAQVNSYLAVGRNGARGGSQRLPSRDISAQALSEIAPAQLFHATTHACSWKAWVPRLHAEYFPCNTHLAE